ncbi:MAG: helix-turn-helix domain-containing protein [Polycyclovorans sp.]|nr:helix-turn-helix domain-containing protein [Alphaproteobacteria bacterium]MDP1542331.1 helix-turn-helix domain-containing protein [Polycyclovorans sp.]
MTDSSSAWRGQARIGIGWGLFTGYAGDADPHAHHAVQILLANTPQAVWTPSGGGQRYLGVVIGADIVHRLEPTTEPVTLLYLEPHSVLGRRSQHSLRDGLGVLDAAQVRAARHALGEAPDNAAISALVEAIVSNDARTQALTKHDAAIERLIDALPQTLPDGLSATHLAAQVGLSKSRFLHRFRDHTGIPLRPYLRWRRLLLAMTQVFAGHSLTSASVAAGFADAAHFTRTFRRHFGIAPKALLTLQTAR